jgi:hypothetical protein
MYAWRTLNISRLDPRNERSIALNTIAVQREWGWSSPQVWLDGSSAPVVPVTDAKGLDTSSWNSSTLRDWSRTRLSVWNEDIYYLSMIERLHSMEVNHGVVA